MDIQRELERILETVPVNAYLTPPIKRTLLATTIGEIRRLRVINAGLIRQLNGVPDATAQEQSTAK